MISMTILDALFLAFRSGVRVGGVFEIVRNGPTSELSGHDGC